MVDLDVMTDQGVRTMIMRGGTSKGAYFVAEDLPADTTERDDLLMRIMGTPDDRQIDGIGGAHPLTSKAAIVSRSAEPGVDVEYLFLQVGVGEPTVTDRQNCGNLLAGVAPFAVERGLIEAADGDASTVIRMLNTDSLASARFLVEGGLPVYEGGIAISGVPGTGASIRLDFDDTAGGSTGALFPTGNRSDEIAGVSVTLIDNGMPVVVVEAADLGVSGDESCAELEANDDLRRRLEEIRIEAGLAMNLGEVADLTVPKMTLVSPPRHGGHVSTRTFIPHRCHDAIGVLGAVSVATACRVPGAIGFEVALQEDDSDVVVIEHPTGTFEATVGVTIEDGVVTLGHSGIVRTARKLMDGTVFPRSAT